MQGRGLKRDDQGRIVGAKAVAPYAGAWIETSIRTLTAEITRVAPYAGAWIETGVRGNREAGCLSPLMQGRGLKRVYFDFPVCSEFVAPYAGAWIETPLWPHQ